MRQPPVLALQHLLKMHIYFIVHSHNVFLWISFLAEHASFYLLTSRNCGDIFNHPPPPLVITTDPVLQVCAILRSPLALSTWQINNISKYCGKTYLGIANSHWNVNSNMDKKKKRLLCNAGAQKLLVQMQSQYYTALT